MKLKMIEYIKADIHRQKLGEYSDLGKEFDSIILEKDLSPNYYIVWNFWDSWIDECRHGFPGFYKGVSKGDWPDIAKEILSNIETDTPINNEFVLKYFDRRKK